ncbi:hypothetical protein IAQ61_006598, partial [Plenodomus lingam]
GRPKKERGDNSGAQNRRRPPRRRSKGLQNGVARRTSISTWRDDVCDLVYCARSPRLSLCRASNTYPAQLPRLELRFAYCKSHSARMRATHQRTFDAVAQAVCLRKCYARRRRHGVAGQFSIRRSFGSSSALLDIFCALSAKLPIKAGNRCVVRPETRTEHPPPPTWNQALLGDEQSAKVNPTSKIWKIDSKKWDGTCGQEQLIRETERERLGQPPKDCQAFLAFSFAAERRRGVPLVHNGRLFQVLSAGPPPTLDGALLLFSTFPDSCAVVAVHFHFGVVALLSLTPGLCRLPLSLPIYRNNSYERSGSRNPSTTETAYSSSRRRIDQSGLYNHIMSYTIKLSLLALVSTAAAVPHFGANPHAKFHGAKAARGHVKPYPANGWSGASNNTAVMPNPTASYPDDKTTTIDETTTSTQTLYTTVYVKPSTPAVAVASVSSDQCGPATVTVTAKEKVTITVIGGGAGYTPAPQSSAAPVPSQSPVPSKPDNEHVASSKPPADYPAATPEATTSSPAPDYPAKTPEAAQTTSSMSEYAVPSHPPNKPVVSSSSATPSPSPSPSPPSGNGYTGHKRGLAYNAAHLCKTLAGKFGFGYNWGQVEKDDIGTQFIPMMHKPSDSSVEEWLGNVDKAVKKGTTAVMGFNECDHAEQCNMSPEVACASWKQYMNPVKSAHADITIIGPSVTNSGQPNMGLTWLSRFHDCCPEAIVDATNIHFYDIYEEGLTLERFKAQVKKANEIYGKPVWVTEFGLNPGSASSEQATIFLKGAMEYLDGAIYVQGYSWFKVGEGENQLNTNGGLSPLGEAYAS